MYVLYVRSAKMVEISVSKARSNLSELINQVVYSGQRFCLERRGKNVVAIVSMEDLELLEALEDKLDIADAKKALKSKDFVSWKKTKKKLGL